MSFNRAIYDPCAYNKRLDESTSVLTYNLDPNRYYNCNQCRIQFGVVGGNDVSLSACNLVDLESDLRNQTRLYSLCPEKKYLPTCDLNCKSKLGLPCGSRCCKNEVKYNLPECNIIQYKPRIDNVGYELKYPSCPKNPSFSCPPKNCRLPVSNAKVHGKGKGKGIYWSQKPVQYGYTQWANQQGIPPSAM